jgi:hypothetical protein
MNKIKELISHKDWDSLIAEYTSKKICETLNFSETMWLAMQLAYDDWHNDKNQQFSLTLIFELKDHFKDEWKGDWKNEVFLGDLCSFLCLYEEQYIAYKAAYDKLADPPASLLLLLSGCLNTPGTPPITEEEAESYLKRAASKKVTFETALMMRSLYERKGKKFQAAQWDNVYRKLEKENVCSDQLIPDILK